MNDGCWDTKKYKCSMTNINLFKRWKGSGHVKLKNIPTLNNLIILHYEENKLFDLSVENLLLSNNKLAKITVNIF